MLFIKDGNKFKTLKEIAVDYRVPLHLLQGRYQRGFKTVEELTRPKHYNVQK